MIKHDKALLPALSAVLLWSTVATAFKIALRHTDYMNLLFYSSLTSAAALFIILIANGKIGMLKAMPRRAVIKSMLLGVLNPFLYYLVLFRAYSLLRAQEALVLNYTWAVMVVIFSAVILKRKVKALGYAAILISFAGVFVIATKGSLDFRIDEPAGMGLALGSSVIWALFWIFNIDKGTDEVLRLFLSFLSGFILIAGVLLATGRMALPGAEGILASVYIGLFEMGITFVLWTKALNTTDNISRTGNLVYLSPFLSLAFIAFILGESLLLSSFAGLALILAGIIIQQTAK